jgi:hypothetical protein
MKTITRYMAAGLLLGILGLTWACGGDSDGDRAAEDRPESAVTGSVPDNALPLTSAPFVSVFDTAGFELAYYAEFPSSSAGPDGRLILYRSATGGDDGGMVFVQESGARYEWVWHWYFEDISPTRFEKVEINRDGLWDIRLFARDDGPREFVQDETFALPGAARSDRIALNGRSSETVPGHPLWHCFDANHNTAWTAPLADGEPYIELRAPFGLADGILAVTAMPDHRPERCRVEADGKRVQSFELEPTSKEQLVKLVEEAKTASRLRIVFESRHGDGNRVAVAELSIK